MENVDYFLLSASDSEEDACGYDPFREMYIQHQTKLKSEQDAIDSKEKEVMARLGLEKSELLASGRTRVLNCRTRRDLNPQMKVAVKISSLDHEDNEKFEKEAYLLRKLNGLGVANFVHAMTFPDLGLAAVVTELYSGGTLTDAISSKRISGPFQQAKIVFGLINVVNEIHRKDIVHGNICPDNILINSSGFPVLSGLGSAVWLRPDEYLVRGVPGTAPYLAPEIVEQPFEYHDSYRADIFSLGMVLSKVLFPEEFQPSAPELLKILATKLLPYNSVHAVFQDLLKHLITSDPEERYDSRDIQDYMFIHCTRISRVTEALEAANGIAQYSLTFTSKDSPAVKRKLMSLHQIRKKNKRSSFTPLNLMLSVLEYAEKLPIINPIFNHTQIFWNPSPSHTIQ